MSTPMVPQRPARSQDTSSAGSSALDVPQIPPRPARNVERSVSPSRPVIRSPLNDSPFASNIPVGGGMTRPLERLTKVSSVPSLPLVGQEGMEYACLVQQQIDSLAPSGNHPDAPNETRNISGDLPMHAPKASVAAAAARSQIAPMTRIDSADAAVAGIGKPQTEYVENELSSRTREYRPSSSLSRELTRSISRPESFQSEDHDHGIPAIGLQVPMYPNAGDVQAPSPGPAQLPPSTGVGFFNSGGQAASTHGRRKSTGFVGPPGSYGLHGHGLIHKDQFEKTWYQKHPEELSKEEQGAYGPGMGTARSQWALTSDELNKLVRDSAYRQVNAASLPDEDFGYKLSEEIASQNNSPQLRAVKSRTHSQTYAESPLRFASFPEDVGEAHAFDSENEDDNIPLGPPRKISTPALASDEVSKGQSSPWAHAAVSAQPDDDYFGTAKLSPTQTRSGPNSRATSRPGSARFHQHDVEGAGTPLDEIEEYEPLFDDEDEVKTTKKRPLTAVERLKRPDLEKRFPSLDIWEDTPTSLQLHTTVSGPQEPDERLTTLSNATRAFEPPEKELTRQGETAEPERTSYLEDSNRALAKPRFKPGVEEDMLSRPGSQRRFPSRDIWEDTPDSLRLVTTLSEEEVRELVEAGAVSAGLSKIQDTPVVPSRPVRTKAAPESTQAQPSIPPRPARAKPQVPPRPIKTSQDDSTEGASLTKTTSAGSAISNEMTSPTDRSVPSPTSPKSKPTVPLKPQVGSSKFASIKAGFMNDLNSRLQQGPLAKKPEQQPEPVQEEEKAPLLDARKGRARGPVRRKPAEQSPSDRSVPSATSSAGWSIVQSMNVWSISNMDSDDVIVGAPASSSDAPRAQISKPTPQTKPAIALVQPTNQLNAGHTFAAPPLASNTAGESLSKHNPVPQLAEENTSVVEPAEDEPIAPVSPLATNTAGESLSKPTVGYPEPTQQYFPDTTKDASATEDLTRSTEVLDAAAAADESEPTAQPEPDSQVSN